MVILRGFLIVATVAIYLMTFAASASHGINWPAVAVHDLMALNWRSQFDTDFILYLLLGATWIAWREGGTARGWAFGAVSVVLGGMFSFPYLLHATYVAEGDVRRVLLGVRQQGAWSRPPRG
ncbi:MAG: hypothetical protein QNK05_25555 [Myxococcota bacterium]|nr:hypothetical protein [Myxococcota bacterium]